MTASFPCSEHPAQRHKSADGMGESLSPEYIRSSFYNLRLIYQSFMLLQEVVDGLADLGLCEASLGEVVNGGVLSCVKPKGMLLCEQGWPDLLGGRPSDGGGSGVEDGEGRDITGAAQTSVRRERSSARGGPRQTLGLP